MSGLTTACEALDDDHAAAAARTRTRTRQYALLIGRGRCGRLRLFCGGWSSEQLARSRDVGSTIGFGKQPVVPQMQLKAPDIVKRSCIRRSLEKRGKPLAGANVASLRTRAQLARVHVFDHALAQRGDTSVVISNSRLG
jgi:hypothetical protein